MSCIERSANQDVAGSMSEGIEVCHSRLPALVDTALVHSHTTLTCSHGNAYRPGRLAMARWTQVSMRLILCSKAGSRKAAGADGNSIRACFLYARYFDSRRATLR